MNQNKNIVLRKGRIEDTNRADEIFNLARKSMREIGITQWDEEYPRGVHFENDVKLGHAVVCEVNGEVMAVASAYIGVEEAYNDMREGSWITDAPIYGIIHRIAVDPKARNLGLGTAIIKYLEDLCKEEAVVSMRCDTQDKNFVMRNLMEKHGYKKCGYIYYDGIYKSLAFEKIIEI